MRLAVLGPVLLEGADGPVPVVPRKARELVTLLALEHPRRIPLDRLAESLWDEPPPAAAKTIQAHLSRLRRMLVAAGAPAPAIEGGPHGYGLGPVEAFDAALDVAQLHEFVRVGRAALAGGAWPVAADMLRRAAMLFRGQPELPATVAAQERRSWLREVRDGLAEDTAEAAVRCGDLATAVADFKTSFRFDDGSGPAADPTASDAASVGPEQSEETLRTE